ncbi:hypothetical protein AURDEDRAFT_149917 [Auricularia subglabra TFB-10046 SS5]|nr:hypothetical protein AURDEDRAFT_149917 [Auricularia subglabra TFB-10046 SS5]
MFFSRVFVSALACIGIALASADSNTDLQALSHSGRGFTLSTRATTDLWRKPPAIDSTNAPHKTIPVRLSKFKRVQVTVAANWTRQYDQGGLVILAPSGGSKFWIKAGIEFFNGKPCVSCVSTDAWSDWSVVPDIVKNNKITIEFAPAEGSLWLYIVDGKNRIPMREVTWFLTKEPEVIADIGVYTARPTAVEGDDSELTVHFEHFELDIGH